MKPLFLIGAALMAGAGIYGFVDYKKASLRKEFQSLYKEEPKKAAQEPTPAVKRDIALEEKKLEAISKKYAEKQPPDIRVEDFSRAVLSKEEIPLPKKKDVKQ
jgi:uncharacterized protein HemX